MSFTRTDPQLMPQVEERMGPGRRLSDTRQAANLSVGEVAARLHLDLGTIRALEADDYDRLPAPTFVRGYLRGYARLLDLPPGPILEAFDQRGLAPPDLVADIAVKAQAHATDVPMRIGTYLIVTGLVLLVVLWWHNQRQMQPQATPATVTNPTPGSLATDADSMARMQVGAGPLPDGGADESMSLVVSPRPLVTDSTGARPATSGDAPPRSGPAPSRLATLKIEPDLGTASLRSAPTPSDNEALQPHPSSPGSSSGTTGPGDTAPTSAFTPISTPGSASGSAAEGGVEDRLVMHFAHESWVEVYDHHDQRLVYRLAREGGVIEARGVGPMRVLLGNADGVRIEFNGRAHPIASPVDSGIARFIVGEPASGVEEAAPTRPGAEPVFSSSQ